MTRERNEPGPKCLGPSDQRTLGLSDPQTVGPPDNRTLGLLGPLTIGLSEYWAVTFGFEVRILVLIVAVTGHCLLLTKGTLLGINMCFGTKFINECMFFSVS